MDKLVLSDSQGRLTVRGRRPRLLWPAVPDQESAEGAADAALRWLEEYAARLEAGVYQVRGRGGRGPGQGAACGGGVCGRCAAPAAGREGRPGGWRRPPPLQ
jgi:hypothetical protein